MNSNTTMFRVRYTGDNGAIQNTKGWAWCDGNQPGLTFAKWKYSVDNDPDNHVWDVVGPLELTFERGWSKKRDRELDALPVHSMKFAMGLLPDPYNVQEVRQLVGIPEPAARIANFDAHASADALEEIRLERLVRDQRWVSARAAAMTRIEAVLGQSDEEPIDLEAMFGSNVGSKNEPTSVSALPTSEIEPIDFEALFAAPKSQRKAASSAPTKGKTSRHSIQAVEPIDLNALFG